MIKLQKLFIGAALLLFGNALSACAPSSPFEHYFSNQIRFTDLGITDIRGKGFIEDQVGRLNLKSYTDGDTAVFHLSAGEADTYTVEGKSYTYVTVRYLGIDTPESTSSIEAWGKAASNYGKSLLTNAEGIIVDATSIDRGDKTLKESIEDRVDSNGTRWLAMIWYCPQGGDPKDLNQYRSYQLDMIEECYTFCTAPNLSTHYQELSPYVYTADKSKEPELYERYKDTDGKMTLGEVMNEADIRCSEIEQRFTGYQTDPHYDYSTTPTDYTITQAVEQFDTLANEGKFVRLKGVVTAMVGVNFYMQDEQGTPLYVYMGISAEVSFLNYVHVGDTIKISGRMAMYGGQKQLSGVKWDSEKTFEVVKGEGAIAMPKPIALSKTDAADKNKLEDLLGKLVKTTLTVSDKSVGNEGKDKSYTLNTTQKITNLGGKYNYLNVRINGALAPGYSRDEMSNWGGKQIEVVAIMGVYSEEDLQEVENYPSYQLIPGNRDGRGGESQTYVKLVEAE